MDIITEPMQLGQELYVLAFKRSTVEASTLMNLITQYQGRLLQIPEFQRHHVWDDKRMQDWANAIRQGTTIPVFFVFTIEGGNYISYLADGCQRLYTTLLILREPQRFGFQETAEVERYLQVSNISIVRRECKDQQEGYKIFVDLNSKGTPANPSEIFKFLMVGTDEQSPSALLYNTLVGKMRERLTIINHIKNKVTRKAANVEIRSALALYYQYNARIKKQPNWEVVRETDLKGKQIEEELADFLRGKSQTEVDEMTKHFLQFVSSCAQLMQTYLTEKHNGEAGHVLSFGLVRHLLYYCIYCRNTGYPTEYRNQYMRAVINSAFNDSSFVIFTDEYGKAILSTGINSNTISCAIRISQHLGLPWESANEKRKRTGNKQNGLDESHIHPFSLFGNGETFLEPASLNRARGAKAVEPEE